jgi:hypothetical protein
MTLALRPADLADLAACRGLVDACGLPLGGLEHGFPGGYVVAADEILVGCAGVELYDVAGLLRSVAVARRSGAEDSVSNSRGPHRLRTGDAARVAVVAHHDRAGLLLAPGLRADRPSRRADVAAAQRGVRGGVPRVRDLHAPAARPLDGLVGRRELTRPWPNGGPVGLVSATDRYIVKQR